MDNLTAKVCCFLRAYHHRNNQVHVFDDTAAELLLGKEYAQIARSLTDGMNFFLPGFNGTADEGLHLIVGQLAPSVLGRSAYCEKMLQNEKRLGCRQYLIFASGYDTFAIRNKDTALAVFELDLPQMLADKIKRIKNSGLESNAVYVPCNIAEASWTEKLIDNGFNTKKKSFASLLGISYYLSRDEFKAVLHDLSDIMPEGSAICLDYPTEDKSRTAKMNRTLAQGAGENMKALYSYGDMELLLMECGFLIYEHLGHNEMTNRYFSEYNSTKPEYLMKAPDGVEYILAVRK